MSEDVRFDTATPAPAGRPPLVSRHLLTWWFGLVAMGGMGFGLYADRHPFGRGVLAHPTVVFVAGVLAGLATLRLLYARPLLQVISARCLAAGAVIAATCFCLGRWFSSGLMY
jgi:hypothetical protein